MKKKVFIEGMSCKHCVAHVEEALKELDGVKKVKVSLDDKNAVVDFKDEIEDSAIKAAVEDAGYDVVKIENI
ncbi:heavy-metal-associated domain-containing protein [Clostridium fermenticellae]|uniref:Copper chaperone CopZ n=1 Tax=Clostridium fermenticellae TaxID=2068654 RepID=A0A386H4D0_9CLOT|nr:copper ion binding protein [Clostridium fermenticellae]AYD40345.1 heavy-metal-associated domain-containing protein [Clostridium fermenticellae]